MEHELHFTPFNASQKSSSLGSFRWIFIALLYIELPFDFAFGQWIDPQGPILSSVSMFCNAPDGSLFAASSDGTIFQLQDSDSYWSFRSSGITSNPVHSFEVIPYADHTYSLLVATRQSIDLSADEGIHWIKGNLPSSNDPMVSTIVIPDNQAVPRVFVYTLSGSMYVSADNCSTWKAVSEDGFPHASRPTAWYVSDSLCLVGLVDGSVYRSTNHGLSWTLSQSTPLITLEITTFVREPGGKLVLSTGSIMGTYASSDDGETWNCVGPSTVTDTFVNQLFVGPDGCILAATTLTGVLRTTDGGASWTSANTGLSASGSITAIISKGSMLYASTASGLFASGDSAANWHGVSVGLKNLNLSCFAVIGEKLFVGTEYGGVYVSPDKGVTWYPSSVGLPINTSARIIQPCYDTTGLNSIFVVTETGVYRSTDRGSTWFESEIETSPVKYTMALISVPGSSGGSVMYAFTLAGGMYVSRDFGESWWHMGGIASRQGVDGFAISPSGRVYAATSSYVYTLANGVSWLRAGTTGMDYSAINAVGACANENVLAAAEDAGIYLSADTGMTWHSVLTTSFVYNIVPVTSATAAGVVFAGTSDGVFCSKDNGAHWFPVDTNAAMRKPGPVVVFDDDLYVGSSQSVLRQSIQSLITTVPLNRVTQVPQKFALDQNYPNPFNPSTTVRYGLSTQSRVQLRIYDILGRLVEELVNAEQAPGWSQVVWNAKVAAGLYFYRLEAVSVSDPAKRFVDVKKMILLK